MYCTRKGARSIVPGNVFLFFYHFVVLFLVFLFSFFSFVVYQVAYARVPKTALRWQLMLVLLVQQLLLRINLVSNPDVVFGLKETQLGREIPVVSFINPVFSFE